jgi:hypothetical protein
MHIIEIQHASWVMNWGYLINYTLYKNPGFWLFNSQCIFRVFSYLGLISWFAAREGKKVKYAFANTTAEGKKLNPLLRNTSGFQIWLIMPFTYNGKEEIFRMNLVVLKINSHAYYWNTTCKLGYELRLFD